MAILLTEKAADAIKNIIKEQGLAEKGTCLRVAAKSSGCCGLTYLLDLTEESRGEMDQEIDCNGVRILCDAHSYQYLDGAEIDFRDQATAKGFVFTNTRPQSGGGCACGKDDCR